MNWTQAQYDEHIKKFNNHAAGRTANMEPHTGNAPFRKEKTARFNSPVDIIIRSYRHRLADADGISAKAAIDGLVMCGILEDDSPKEVKSVSYSQEKTTGEEHTEIIITEVEP